MSTLEYYISKSEYYPNSMHAILYLYIVYKVFVINDKNKYINSRDNNQQIYNKHRKSLWVGNMRLLILKVAFKNRF